MIKIFEIIFFLMSMKALIIHKNSVFDFLIILIVLIIFFLLEKLIELKIEREQHKI